MSSDQFWEAIFGAGKHILTFCHNTLRCALQAYSGCCARAAAGPAGRSTAHHRAPCALRHRGLDRTQGINRHRKKPAALVWPHTGCRLALPYPAAARHGSWQPSQQVNACGAHVPAAEHPTATAAQSGAAECLYTADTAAWGCGVAAAAAVSSFEQPTSAYNPAVEHGGVRTSDRICSSSCRCGHSTGIYTSWCGW